MRRLPPWAAGLLAALVAIALLFVLPAVLDEALARVGAEGVALVLFFPAVAAPVMAARGVRRSCDTELSSVLRRRSASASMESRPRSSGAAMSRASVSRSSTRVGPSGSIVSSGRTASTPTGPSLPGSGR